MRYGDFQVNFGSTWRGLLAMRQRPLSLYMEGWATARWHFERGDFGWWLHLWTPRWHQGRGPYLTLGAGRFRILRGY